MAIHKPCPLDVLTTPSCIPVSGQGLFKLRCGRAGLTHYVISPLSTIVLSGKENTPFLTKTKEYVENHIAEALGTPETRQKVILMYSTLTY